jgi:hypothetical protein
MVRSALYMNRFLKYWRLTEQARLCTFFRAVGSHANPEDWFAGDDAQGFVERNDRLAEWADRRPTLPRME